MINLIKTYFDGSKAKITGYRQIADNEDFDGTKFKAVDQDVYDYVVQNYELGNLTFEDHLTGVKLQDVTFVGFDQISAMKNNALNVYIKNELRDGDSSFDMFLISVKFTLLNNQMCAAGYFFTVDNKEEIYLNVLNSGDAQLIGILEDYIEVLEALSKYSSKVNNYIAMKDALNEINTLQEVYDIYASYTARNLVDDMNR